MPVHHILVSQPVFQDSLGRLVSEWQAIEQDMIEMVLVQTGTLAFAKL